MAANTTLCPTISRLRLREWAEHVFFHDNSAGVVIEWWCHSASSYWFLAERNTISDQILRTFPADEIFNQRIDFAAAPEPEPKPKANGESQ